MLSRTKALIALIAVFALIVAACGDDDDATTTTAAAAGDTTTTTAAEADNAIKTCLVTDLAGVDDRSFNASAWAGVQAAMDGRDRRRFDTASRSHRSKRLRLRRRPIAARI